MSNDKPLAVGFVEDRWEAGVAGLSHEAEYVYFRMCKAMWAAGRGVHPDDVTAACRFYKGTKKGLAELERKGKLRLLDGLWVNDRALAEHARAVERQAKSRARGKAGAGARWGQNDSQTDAQAHAQASPEHSPSNSHPDPYPLEKIPTTERGSSAGASRARSHEGTLGLPPEEPYPGYDLDAAQAGLAGELRPVWAGFVEHHHGSGKLVASIPHAWRKWCRREAGFRQRDAPAAAARPATTEELIEMAERMHRNGTA